MKYTDEKIINDFFKSNQDFIQIQSNLDCYKSIQVNDYIYISCYLKTASVVDYCVVYEPYNNYVKKEISNSPYNTLQIKTKASAIEEDDYWSAFNEGFFGKRTETPGWITYCDEAEADITHVGVGNALIIMNSHTLEVLNVYYFKDTYNLDCPVKFIDVVGDKVIVSYWDYNYVFCKAYFDNYSFVTSEKHYVFGDIWINHPYYGYDIGCGWAVVDIQKKEISLIHALYNDQYPSFRNLTDCKYDYKKSVFVFYSDSERVSMDYNVLMAKEDDINKLNYTSTGFLDNSCEYYVKLGPLLPAYEYDNWEKEQNEFKDRCFEIVQDLETVLIYQFSHDVNYERIDENGMPSIGSFKVSQHFCGAFCLEHDVDLSSLPDGIQQFTNSIKSFQQHDLYYPDFTYEKIIHFIKKIGDEKDILVYYKSTWPDWSEEVQRDHLEPIIKAPHNWFECDMLSEKNDTVVDIDTLKKFQGKYIVILDVMTDNAKLKKVSKLIREVFPAKAPCICYFSLFKCLNHEESEHFIQNKIRQEKERNRIINNLRNSVSSWIVLYNELRASYLFNYYPITCDFKATEEEWRIRRLVWNFKNDPDKGITDSQHQEALNEIIPMLEDKLRSSFDSESLTHLTLVCIPASTQVKTQARYEEYSNRFCHRLGMINAYDYIKVIRDRIGSHEGGTGINTEDLDFDESFFKGKYVLLFDDIITKGTTMIAMKRKLESLGATVVGGLSLGKSKHERP